MEFDESQHFTAPRAEALEHYPPGLSIGFPIEDWHRHCVEINAHDNDPVDRDEKRVWYDTLRDFAPKRLGLGPTVRLYSREREWCSLDPNREMDVEAFRMLIDERRDIARSGEPLSIENQDRLMPWVATVMLSSNRPKEREKDPAFDEGRFQALPCIIEAVLASTAGDGVILFPGGWVHGGFDTAASQIEPLFQCAHSVLTEARERQVVVCIGIDGRFNRPLENDPYDQDQLAVAFDRTGLIAAGRKFFWTDEDERDSITLAAGYAEREEGLPRTFTVGDTGFYLFVCYDIYGPARKPDKYPNPGVDVGLNLIHRFCPKKQGPSQTNYFPRHGFAPVSRNWKIPIFGTGVFYRRPLEANWPSGVWHPLESEGLLTHYDEYGISPAKTIGPIAVEEGEVVVRVYEGYRPAKPAVGRSEAADPARKGGKGGSGGRRDQFPVDDLADQREVFFESVRRFAEGHRRSGEIRNMRTKPKDQCWVDIESWRRLGKWRPLYEFYDLIERQGRDEVTVEFQCGTAPYGALANLIKEQMAVIAAEMPGLPRPNVDTTTPKGWTRLQFTYPGTANPDEIAGGMRVLIDRTRRDVDVWLAEHGNA